MGLSFVDIETFGLDPERHQVWEVALVRPGEENLVWWIEPSAEELARADSTALRLTRFYERSRERSRADRQIVGTDDREDFAVDFAVATAGSHLVGASISFDALRLERFLRAYGCAPAWHYHLVDVEALVAGKLGMSPPWNSQELSEAMGVPKPVDEHTALADALWAQDLYEAVFTTGGR